MKRGWVSDVVIGWSVRHPLPNKLSGPVCSQARASGFTTRARGAMVVEIDGIFHPKGNILVMGVSTRNPAYLRV